MKNYLTDGPGSPWEVPHWSEEAACSLPPTHTWNTPSNTPYWVSNLMESDMRKLASTVGVVVCVTHVHLHVCIPHTHLNPKYILKKKQDKKKTGLFFLTHLLHKKTHWRDKHCLRLWHTVRTHTFPIPICPPYTHTHTHLPPGFEVTVTMTVWARVGCFFFFCDK